jgi:hypothetical protein
VPVSEWVLTFRPLPSDVPVEVRVRRLLKISLRAFGLKCVDMAVVDKDEKRESNNAKHGD